MLGSLSSRFRPDPEAERRQRALEIAKRVKAPPVAPRVRLARHLKEALRRSTEDVKRLQRAWEEAERLDAGQKPGPVEPPKGSFRRTMLRVAAAHGVRLSELTGRCRKARLMMVRFECYWIGVYAHGLSSPQVGKLMGGRDHSTVLYGRDRVDSILLDTFAMRGEAALALCEDLRREALKAAFATRSERYTRIQTERQKRAVARLAAKDADIAARVREVGSLKGAARAMHLGEHGVRRALQRHLEATGGAYEGLLAELRQRRAKPKPPPEVVLEAYRRLGSQRATAKELHIDWPYVQAVLRGEVPA